jgi:hypothetical protein
MTLRQDGSFMEAIDLRSKDVLRKAILAVFAIALVGTLSPTVASARGGFGGGGFGRSGFAASSDWRGGGRRVGGWRWRGPAYGAVGVDLGIGLASSYYGYPDGYEDDYPYGYGEYAEYGPWAYGGHVRGGCYARRQRGWASYAWRLRAVQRCDGMHGS